MSVPLVVATRRSVMVDLLVVYVSIRERCYTACRGCVWYPQQQCYSIQGSQPTRSRVTTDHYPPRARGASHPSRSIASASVACGAMTAVKRLPTSREVFGVGTTS